MGWFREAGWILANANQYQALSMLCRSKVSGVENAFCQAVTKLY